MPLLLANEQLDGGEIIRVADLFGVAGRGRVQVAAVRRLAALPALQRARNGGQRAGRYLGTRRRLAL